MDARREHILKTIVDEYIRTAEPVGSKTLVERYGLDVSSATVRNEMVELERSGYIAAPHTSAGRIPTEKAFVYYLQHFVVSKPTAETRGLGSNPRSRSSPSPRGGQPPPSGGAPLRRWVGLPSPASAKSSDDEGVVRTLVKSLSELSGEMVVAAFDPRTSFYAGVGNLLSKPDFDDLEVVKSLSVLIDRFDDVMEEIFERVPQDPQVMIGRQNPFGGDMSAILVKYRLPSGHIGILGLVGPMRMDYGRNIALLERAKELLDES